MNSSNTSKRRLALKLLGGSALSGAMADKLPATWQRPLVDTAALPAHAQSSPLLVTGASLPPGTSPRPLFGSAWRANSAFRSFHIASIPATTARLGDAYPLIATTSSIATDDTAAINGVPPTTLEPTATIPEPTIAPTTTAAALTTPTPTTEAATTAHPTTTVTTTATPIPTPEPGSGFQTLWRVEPGDLALTIPVNSDENLIYDYQVYWGDGKATTGHTGDATHTYAAAGDYTVTITGIFPAIRLRDHACAPLLIEIQQWGRDINWETMSEAFYGANNMNITATDVPDLSEVADMSGMFQSANSLNADLSGWDTSNVTNMHSMFRNATSFDGDISTWNTGNVTNMSQMFRNANSFDINIGDWNTNRVTDMSWMFRFATSFNQDLNGWKTGNVTDMGLMFQYAYSFNGDISLWNVEKVVDMSIMFELAVSFNQDISRWNVGNVIRMRWMFYGATSFNQNIGGWNVRNVLDMDYMFERANLETKHYDALLNGWANLGNLQRYVQLDARSQYSRVSAASRKKLISVYHWRIYDRGLDEDYVLPPPIIGGDQTLAGFRTLWRLEANNLIFTIPINPDTSLTYDYHVDWGDGEFTTGHTGDAVHTYAATGDYTVTITGTFPAIRLRDRASAGFLREIQQWGNGIVWRTMNGAFYGANHMTITATDVPYLVGVADMSGMFQFATSFNSDLNDWDTTNITDMSSMFDSAASFNGNISNWKTGNVTDMSLMFFGATSFNGDLSRWDVSNVTSMSNMLDGATLTPEKYDALLIGWASLPSVQSGVSFHAGGSQYTSVAAAARAKFRSPGGESDETFPSGFEPWKIVDRGQVPDSSLIGFKTLWRIEPNSLIFTIPVNPDSSLTYDYQVNWGDGNVTTGHTGDAVHTYAVAGDYMVTITGTFPAIRLRDHASATFLREIQQWGNGIVWRTMNGAFYGANHMTITATDVPYLAEVTDMSGMFRSATYFTGDLSAWDTGNVTDMSEMFDGAFLFNGDISNWNTGNVTNMNLMFGFTYAFNGDISGWDTGNVTDMSLMFENATTFNGDLNGWDTGNVTNMSLMFENATDFNGNISDWDVKNVTDMRLMFGNAKCFDGDISRWNTESVTDMSQMFENAIFFNGNISDWDVRNVTNMTQMFEGVSLSTRVYDSILLSWNSINVRYGITFGGGNSLTSGSGSRGYAARQALFNKGWTIVDGHGTLRPRPTMAGFKTLWQIDADNLEFTIPINPNASLVYDYQVDWGDGSATTGHTGDATHTYAMAGDYVVTITGTFPAINLSSYTSTPSLMEVQQWGYSIEWRSMREAFSGAINMNVTAIDVPNLRGVTDMSRMFSNATFLNADFSGWNTESVTDMSGLFSQATYFNGNISSWNTSNVTNMSSMFSNAFDFNGDISRWDVGSVTDMSSMFFAAHTFNGDISRWNVENVIGMSGMFDSATSFNGDLGNWNVSNVRDMDFILYDVSLSIENYDSLLNGWIEHINPEIEGEFIIDSRYSRNAQAAHEKLSSYLFISDFGLDPDYPLLTTTEAADTTGES